MFVMCVFAKHSICKGLFCFFFYHRLISVAHVKMFRDVWPDSRGWMCLHVCGFWIWRLDLEKSGNGHLSCCCLVNQTGGQGEMVLVGWSGGLLAHKSTSGQPKFGA